MICSRRLFRLLTGEEQEADKLHRVSCFYIWAVSLYLILGVNLCLSRSWLLCLPHLVFSDSLQLQAITFSTQLKMTAPKEPSSDLKLKLDVLEDGQISDTKAGTTEIQQFDQVNTARLLRKIDWHLVPFLALLYLYVTSTC
jgi:hypothetical protein